MQNNCWTVCGQSVCNNRTVLVRIDGSGNGAEMVNVHLADRIGRCYGCWRMASRSRTWQALGFRTDALSNWLARI